MKNTLVLPCLAALVALGSTASAQTAKIGTVDMKRVFESYYKTKEAESKINEKRSAARKEMEDRMEVGRKMLEEVKKLDGEIQKPELSASAKAEKTRIRNEKANQLQVMDREIREFQQTEEKQINELSVRMRAGIVDDINKVVEGRVKAENYDIVFDKSGPSMNNVPTVMFSRDNYDFTTDVVTLLNKTKGAASETPTAVPIATPKSKSK